MDASSQLPTDVATLQKLLSQQRAVVASLSQTIRDQRERPTKYTEGCCGGAGATESLRFCGRSPRFRPLATSIKAVPFVGRLRLFCCRLFLRCRQRLSPRLAALEAAQSPKSYCGWILGLGGFCIRRNPVQHATRYLLRIPGRLFLA
jgi:hypothetical protein